MIMRHLHTCSYVDNHHGVPLMTPTTGTTPDSPPLGSVRRRLIDHDEADRLADLFKLIGEPSRARILHALLLADELAVGELATVCDISETSASHALRLLRTAGAVRSRRQGRSIIYRLDDAHVRSLLDLTIEHVRHQPADPHADSDT